MIPYVVKIVKWMSRINSLHQNMNVLYSQIRIVRKTLY